MRIHSYLYETSETDYVFFLVCHIRFAVKVKKHSNPNKGSKGSAGVYNFATAKPQSVNEWTLSEARWAIENNGYSSSGENRINRIKWIYYSRTVWIKLSHWLVCHFSTELFCGRSANTKSSDLLFFTCTVQTVAFYTHCIYFALYFTWVENLIFLVRGTQRLFSVK